MAVKVENTGLTCRHGYFFFKEGEGGKVTIGRLGFLRRDVEISQDSEVKVSSRFFFQKKGSGFVETDIRLSKLGDHITVASPCGIDGLIAGYGFGVLGGHLEVRRVRD